jgi:hypothetical protein
MALSGSNVLAGGRVSGTISGDEIVLGVVAENDAAVEFIGRMRDGKVSGSGSFRR